MRVALPLLLVCIAACGSVKDQPADAAQQIDAPSCGPTDQVDSCGATCAKCTASGARRVATCDGTSCGSACVGGAPTCNDMTCSQLVFDFEDGTIEGVTADTGLVLMVGVHGGSKALAIATPNLVDSFLTVPVCLSGMIDISALTLSATVFYEDPNAPTGGQYFLQAFAPVKGNNNAVVGTMAIEANKPQTFSMPLSKSSFSVASATVQFEYGTLGAAFSGTVWFDDIKIQ